MPKLSLAPLGVNTSMPSDHERAPLPPRQAIAGWTTGAARRNRRFLMKIDPMSLDGIGLAVTLTTKEIPTDAKAWAKMTGALLHWCRRRGLTRYHWVTEWQGRGAPHLHAVLFFDTVTVARAADQVWHQVDDPEGFEALSVRRPGAVLGFLSGGLAQDLTAYWCDKLAEGLGAGPKGQHVVPLEDTVDGWFQYLAKHAWRGAAHYQRSQGALPPGWTSSGRLWGRGGAWELSETDLWCDDGTWQRFHRLCWRWQRADALKTLALAKRHGNKAQRASAMGQLRHLRRSGSFLGRSEKLLELVRMAGQARAAGELDAADKLDRAVTRRRKKDGKHRHRLRSSVRGMSSHMGPDIYGPLLYAAMRDRPEAEMCDWDDRPYED